MSWLTKKESSCALKSGRLLPWNIHADHFFVLALLCCRSLTLEGKLAAGRRKLVEECPDFIFDAMRRQVSRSIWLNQTDNRVIKSTALMIQLAREGAIIIQIERASKGIDAIQMAPFSSFRQNATSFVERNESLTPSWAEILQQLALECPSTQVCLCSSLCFHWTRFTLAAKVVTALHSTAHLLCVQTRFEWPF